MGVFPNAASLPRGWFAVLVLPDPMYFLHCCNFWEGQMNILNFVLKKKLIWLQIKENKNLNCWKSVIGVWLVFCCAQKPLSPGFFLSGSDLCMILNFLGGGSFCAVETFHQHKCVTHSIWNIHRKFLVIEYSQNNPNSQLFGPVQNWREWKLAQCLFDSVLMSCWCWVWTKFHIWPHSYHALLFLGVGEYLSILWLLSLEVDYGEILVLWHARELAFSYKWAI